MWCYKISTGDLVNASGQFEGTGYSGAGMTLEEGRNNPALISDPDVGPIPPGFYSIGVPYHHPVEGPCVMNLTPDLDTETFGRSAFHIHGNNASNDASKGCIILGPTIRKQIAMSGDTRLQVVL